MTCEGSPFPMEGFDLEEARAFEARSAFKDYVTEFGIDEVKSWFRSAEVNRNKGRKGFTIPVDDNSGYMTIDTEVSFQRGEGFGPYKIPMDTALAALYEMQEETNPNQ